MNKKLRDYIVGIIISTMIILFIIFGMLQIAFTIKNIIIYTSFAVSLSFIGVYLSYKIEEAEDEYKKTTQLVPIKYERNFKICYDRNTKVIYLVATNGSVTLLVDADGKPLIYEGNIQ